MGSQRLAQALAERGQIDLRAARQLEHDLDLLLTLATENDMELPPELVETGWLTRWATTYEDAEPVPGALDRRQAVEIAETAAEWCTSAVVTASGQPASATGAEVPPPPPPPTRNLGRPERGPGLF